MKSFFSLLGETFRQWNAHKAPKMGAALAYYAMFSLAPLVILVLSLVSLAVERNAARAELIDQFRQLIGPDGANVVEMILGNAASQQTGVWSTIIGFTVLIIGASGVFVELHDSLNQIWEVSSERHPFYLIIKERLLSFVMILVMGFLLLTSFLLSTAITFAGKYLQGRMPALGGIWEWGNVLVSLALVTLLFALIFKVLPGVHIGWRDVWLGALLTAVLFVLGKLLLGFYIGHSAIASSYGAAGSIIIILVWVFYSAQILFFGAEFTRAYALKYGSHRHKAKARKQQPQQ